MKINNKCLILGPDSRSLLNFRGQLIKDLMEAGLSVTVISSKPDANSFNSLKALGVEYEHTVLENNKMNYISDIRTFKDFLILFLKLRPNFVLAYGIKSVIWGGLSARISNTPFFALITGIGYAFHGKSFKRKILTIFVSFLCKIALKKSKAVIFQNKDNQNLFIKKNLVQNSKTYIVNGSGVDTSKFFFTQIPKTNLKFLCVSRLLSEKGLREYAAAAKITKDKYPQTNFLLLGSEDTSKDAIPLKEVNSWSDYVNYIGTTNNVEKIIKECHIFVLPSYHEGLPRSTLEAMSMGRPVLTTNAVGCKETVQEGLNGFKVPVGSIKELAYKMMWFAENKDKIQNMGVKSRMMVEDRFDVNIINREMFRILGLN